MKTLLTALVLCSVFLIQCRTKAENLQEQFVNNDAAKVDFQPSETPAAKVEPRVIAIGDFSNRKSDGEHEWGYSVELWKQEDKICGLIAGSSHSRLYGDPPTGLLEDVQFDPKTGKMSFRAKLTLGLWSDRDHRNLPSQDVYEFEGVLTAKKLKGNLLTSNELCDDKCPRREQIELRRSKDSSFLMDDYQSYSEWKSYADRILNFRGPKW